VAVQSSHQSCTGSLDVTIPGVEAGTHTFAVTVDGVEVGSVVGEMP
jgi:hypothetical protein